MTSVTRSENGQPLVVLPLYLSSKRPIRVVRFLGHGPSDELGPVCAASDRPAAVRALLAQLDHVDFDLFLGEQLAGNRWGDDLGGRVVSREASPTLRLGSTTWDELLARRSANLREQARARERRLARAHDVRFRLADRTSLAGDLDTLFRLHRLTWSGRSAFRHESFHRDFAAQALVLGWLRLWVLEVDERPVAVWYGFRFAGVESYYQAGRDPAWDGSSVGFVLLVHTIREAVADGMDEYRFLRGDERFKYRFADDDPGVDTVAVAGSALGRTVLAVGQAARRVRVVRSAARRLLR
jgi:CelD/BcsL family acetyltransferase involved in cellulose biosynthesis